MADSPRSPPEAPWRRNRPVAWATCISHSLFCSRRFLCPVAQRPCSDVNTGRVLAGLHLKTSLFSFASMPQSLKPPPLQAGDAVRILSLASPVDGARLRGGCEEIGRLGFRPLCDEQRVLARGDFFAW